MKSPKNKRIDFGARSVSRQLFMQAMYQWQLNEQTYTELLEQFSQDKDYKKSDNDYFSDILKVAIAQTEELNTQLEEYLDRPILQLDPVAHAILWLGLYELNERIEIPFRVVINEAVKLSKKFGAEDSHKYINAVLDKAAANIRADEIKVS
jgi:N utilization substance protein B